MKLAPIVAVSTVALGVMGFAVAYQTSDWSVPQSISPITAFANCAETTPELASTEATVYYHPVVEEDRFIGWAFTAEESNRTITCTTDDSGSPSLQ